MSKVFVSIRKQVRDAQIANDSQALAELHATVREWVAELQAIDAAICRDLPLSGDNFELVGMMKKGEHHGSF